MSNIPQSLTDSALTLFTLAISASDPLQMPALINFHFHHGDGDKVETENVPKGCLAMTVGQGDEQQRFVIPVMCVNHQLFARLLKEAEEEYGFDQEGPIKIPCHVEEFCQVMAMIDRETTLHHHHYHYQQQHHFPCFRA